MIYIDIYSDNDGRDRLLIEKDSRRHSMEQVKVVFHCIHRQVRIFGVSKFDAIDREYVELLHYREFFDQYN